MGGRRHDHERETVDDSAIGPPDAARAATLLDPSGDAAVTRDAASVIATAEGDPRAAHGGTATLLPPGTRIGHFVVEEELGAGGMGVVAAAHDQVLDRKVAIKVLRREVFGANVDRAQARLLREAQAMARLQHPNVVTVFEIGTHDGQIFIAMERIDGATLARWLRAQPRTTREILDAFVQAGRGLAAAHERGLVHRDFKPENVLVGRDGQVRVTDFGLVSAQGAGEPTPPPGEAITRDERPGSGAVAAPSGGGRGSPLHQSLTRTGAMMGTPQYMAPEQHAQLAVTAQADQFAFCVALHEALYGAPPFRGATAAELRAAVLAGQLAPVERTSVAPWLRPIVARGLARRPAERWPSMAALLAALSHDPTVVRRRRRWAAAGAGALIAAVAVGALAQHRAPPAPCPNPVGRLIGVWDAPARVQMQAGFTASHQPYAGELFAHAAGALDAYAQRWLAMRTEACEATAVRHEQSPALLDRRMQCLDRRLVELGALTQLLRGPLDGPVLDRAVAAVLALVPVKTCGDADALLAQVALPDDARARAEVIALRGELARATALMKASKPKDALAVATPLVPRARALGYAPVLAEALMALGTAQRDVGDPKVAEATLIEVARTAATAKDDTLVARAMIEQMWVVGYRGGRTADALALVPYIEAAVARAGNDPLVASGLYRYQAILLNGAGKLPEALAAAQRALDLASRASPEGREVAITYTTMAGIYLHLGDHERARAAYAHTRAIYATLYAPDHPEVASADANLANVLLSEGKLDEALARYRTALASSERVNGADSPRTGMLLNNVGIVLGLQARWDEAHPINLRALAIYEQVFGPEHPEIVLPLSNLGDEMLARRRFADAEAYYGRALAAREKALGKDNILTGYPLEMMTRLRLAQGRFAEAQAMARRIVAIRIKELGPATAETGEALLELGTAEAGLGRPADGLATAERGIAMMAGSPADVTPGELGDAWRDVARVARQAGRPARASEAIARARAAYERLEPSPRRQQALDDLAAR